jgi:hypothetical protein
LDKINPPKPPKTFPYFSKTPKQEFTSSQASKIQLPNIALENKYFWSIEWQ